MSTGGCCLVPSTDRRQQRGKNLGSESVRSAYVLCPFHSFVFLSQYTLNSFNRCVLEAARKKERCSVSGSQSFVYVLSTQKVPNPYFLFAVSNGNLIRVVIRFSVFLSYRVGKSCLNRWCFVRAC